MENPSRFSDDLESPMIFVPHGDPEPVEWMAQHSGWVKFPAVFVPHAVQTRDQAEHIDIERITQGPDSLINTEPVAEFKNTLATKSKKISKTIINKYADYSRIATSIYGYAGFDTAINSITSPMNETIIIKIPSPAPLSSTDEISDTAVPSQKMEWDENARLHDKEYADQSEKYISLAQTLPLPEILPAPGGSPNSDLDDSARLLSNAITKLVHKNSHKNNGETELYYLMSKSTPGEIDKIGITSYPNKRYSAAKMCAD